ncbi:DedA family protein [Nonomuraea sp. NPDC051941]|uniref:DedA family protein n=1 Tax=Nonomuraea sp. NPDC051941 TaxID=3364373 RepID=UPI0037C8EB14
MAFFNVLEWLQSLSEPAMLAGAGAIALGEAIIGVGFLLPGEAALLIAAATITSVPEFLLMWAVVTVGALVGNVIGFELGRRVGPPLRNTKLIRRYGGDGWDRASALLRRHGRQAVFTGRLIPLVRSFVPAVAGAAHMPYRTFLPPVAAGAACSTAMPLLVGIAVAAGLKNADNLMLIILGGLLLVVAVVIVIRKLRKDARAKTSAMTTASSGPEDLGPDLEARR